MKVAVLAVVLATAVSLAQGEDRVKYSSPQAGPAEKAEQAQAPASTQTVAQVATSVAQGDGRGSVQPQGRVFDSEGRVVWQRQRQSPSDVPPPNIGGTLIVSEPESHRECRCVAVGYRHYHLYTGPGHWMPGYYYNTYHWPIAYGGARYGHYSVRGAHSEAWAGGGAGVGFRVGYPRRDVTVRTYSFGGSVHVGGGMSSGLTHSPGGRPVRHR